MSYSTIDKDVHYQSDLHSESETEWLVNYCNETHNHLLKSINNIDEQLWNAKLHSSSWSISECAEHILLSEKAILKSIQNTLANDQKVQNSAALKISREELLTQVMDRVSKKVKTIDALEPTNQWSNPIEFKNAFQEHHKEVIAFVKNCVYDLHEFNISSPVGTIDLYQQLIVLAAHRSRHTSQIEEIKYTHGSYAENLNSKVRTHIKVWRGHKEKLKSFWGDLLHHKIKSEDTFDRIFLGDGGFIHFEYFDNINEVLSPEQMLLAAWINLDVPDYKYENIKHRIISFGVKTVRNNNESYIFQSPSGQVFKLSKTLNTGNKFDPSKATEYGADEYGMKKYVFALLESGPNTSIDEKDKAALQKKHLENMVVWAENGNLLLAGPFLNDGPLRGIYIFNVKDISEAENLIHTDPAIKAGSLQMKLFEWYGSAALMALYPIHKTLEKSHVSDSVIEE